MYVLQTDMASALSGICAQLHSTLLCARYQQYSVHICAKLRQIEGLPSNRK